MALTKDFIVQKSIEILNRDGIEGLTMRLLAKELNIKAASLYWHFKDKAELYGAISEMLCDKISIPSDITIPLKFLSDIFNQFRGILLTVRDSVAIFENSIPYTPKRINIIRAVANALLAFGVNPENVATVSNMFNNYVLSFVADEYRLKMITGKKFKELAVSFSPEDRLLLIMPNDFDEQFDYGLRLLFEGLKQMPYSNNSLGPSSIIR